MPNRPGRCAGPPSGAPVARCGGASARDRPQPDLLRPAPGGGGEWDGRGEPVVMVVLHRGEYGLVDIGWAEFAEDDHLEEAIADGRLVPGASGQRPGGVASGVRDGVLVRPVREGGLR